MPAGARVAADPFGAMIGATRPEVSRAEKPSMMEGAMEIVFWMIIAIVVLAIFYVFAVSLRKRKEAFEREPSKSDVAPNTKEHGIDLQARRKTYDDIT